MRDDALGAIEHPAARRRLCRRQYVGQVVARLALAVGEGQYHAAFGDLRQDRPFLRLVAGQPQRGAGQHHRRQIRLQRQYAAKGLHDQHDLDRPAAEPAIFLRERQAQQPLLGIARPHPGTETLGLGKIAAPLRKAVMVGEQPVDEVAQEPLLVGQIEIHGVSPLPRRAPHPSPLPACGEREGPASAGG